MYTCTKYTFKHTWPYRLLLLSYRGVSRQWRSSDHRIILHIGACDSSSTVFVNGTPFPEHRGGSTPIRHDITDALHSHDVRTADVVLIRCTDNEGPGGVIQPCGKQMAKPYPTSGEHVPTIYSNVTGVWQTVWLEAVSARAHLLRVQVVPVFPRQLQAPWHLGVFLL